MAQNSYRTPCSRTLEPVEGVHFRLPMRSLSTLTRGGQPGLINYRGRAERCSPSGKSLGRPDQRGVNPGEKPARARHIM